MLARLRMLIEANEELLVLLLLSRSALTDSDYRSLIKALPRPRNMETGTKYYTEEEKCKLERIIDKLINDPSSATWDDVFELEKINELIWNEKYTPNLRHQAKWVKMVVLVTKAYLIGRGKNNF
jgi:hypothetical protein